MLFSRAVTRRVVWAFALCIGAAGCIGVLVTLPIAPPRPVDVRIRWADRLTEGEKQTAARELGLSLLRVRDDGVWVVRPSQTSPEFVRRVVRDPRVADTAEVDRRLFSLRYEPQTFAQWLTRRYPSLRPWLLTQYDRYSRLLQWSTLLAIVLVAIVVRRAYNAATGSTQWIFSGIPPLSAPALALFRVAYGVAMIFAVLTMFLEPTFGQRPLEWWARTGLIQDIRANPQNFIQLTGAVLACLVMFTIGLIPRVALAGAAAGLICLDGVLLVRRSIHDWSLPTMAMALLILVPWHQGFGVSQTVRRWYGKTEHDSSLPLGLALWIPAFALGIAFLAAAYAKLHYSGLEWITGGAIRYHFIDDGLDAPVSWGMRLATSDILSVMFSFGAVAAEATVWTVIWFREWRVRLAFGVVAAALLTGFFVFQGVFWHAWWALLLAFLPWQQVTEAIAGRLPRLTVLIDGECPLCRRTARVLYSLDWFERLRFVDASDDLERGRVAPGVERDAALGQMHLVDARGTVTVGYDAYLTIGESVPLLWMPRAFASLGPIADAGRSIYGRIASNRLRVGRCTDAVCQPGEPPLPVVSVRTVTHAHLSPWLAFVFGGVLTVQVVVSALEIESQPFVSHFPMYSHTWPSRAAFDAYLHAERRYRITTQTLTHDQLSGRLAALCDPNAVVYPVLDAIIDGGVVQDESLLGLRPVLRSYEDKYGTPLGPLRVLRTERRFDWERGELDRTPRVTFEGIVDLSTAVAGG